MLNEVRQTYWSAVDRKDYPEAQRLLTTHPDEFPECALKMFEMFRQTTEALDRAVTGMQESINP